MPKRNADFRAKTKGVCIPARRAGRYMKSLNLMDLALDKKKLNPPVPKRHLPDFIIQAGVRAGNTL